MTEIISLDEKKEKMLEEMIDNFLQDYPWFNRRLTNMDPEHRDAVGILLETHPHMMLHLKTIFDKNLTEDGWEMIKEGHWRVTRAEQTLMGALAIPEDGQTMHITDFVKGSGIIGLDGVELDSVSKIDRS